MLHYWGMSGRPMFSNVSERNILNGIAYVFGGSIMIEDVQLDLIFDLGVNQGEDSAFYLAKGFRVVGVEADPILVKELRVSFAPQLESKQFILEPVGIMGEPGVTHFYRNTFCDHWSSFFPEYGCRGDTKYEIMKIECVVVESLLQKYGCPYYMKVDIEGADQIVLNQLSKLRFRPIFLSVEEFGLATIDSLFKLGYNMFSLRPQRDKSWARLPNPPREGKWIPRDFTQRDSGPFGLEVPDWMSVTAAKKQFYQKIRTEDNRWLPPPGEWYDLHATYWPRTIDDQALQILG